MADDLQLELNYYQTALEQKTRVNQMEIESQQLCSIEGVCALLHLFSFFVTNIDYYFQKITKSLQMLSKPWRKN